ncbi:pilus assembly protein PilM [Patescibacteria group bacterium]
MEIPAMMKKSFVSISFASQGRIHILELNGSKSKVKSKFMADLPSGLIKEFKVVDSDKLSLVLRDIWRKLRVREKSVGIVVPEFSTYTKVLGVPKLDHKEIDEAIYWQSQEFLPDNSSNYVLDWKILSETDDEYQILVVAIDKELLEGYVTAADKAGLFPLAIETPSLSLVRFASRKTEENLILYIGKSQSLAIVSKGQRIYGSSVMHPDSVTSITKTSKQMLSHYKDISIKKVFMGGQNIDKDVFEFVKKSFEVPTEIINIEIKGIPASEKQRYLIAASMQYKNPSEPADEYTINLLPEAQIKKYQSIKMKLQVWSLSLTVTLFVWVSFLAVLGTYLFFSQSVNSLEDTETPNQVIVERKELLVEEIKKINSRNDKVIKLYKDWVLPQDHINTISKALPDGIVIDEYDLNFETGLVKLKGVAALREDILIFKRELEKNPKVSEISIPISSFEDDRDLVFNLSFSYDDK